MNYQKVIIAGNATEDAQPRQSKKGDSTYATFSMAVNEGKERPTFFPVAVFGKMSEAVVDYVTKGRSVLVEGRMVITSKGRFSMVASRVVFEHLEERPAKAGRRHPIVGCCGVPTHPRLCKIFLQVDCTPSGMLKLW